MGTADVLQLIISGIGVAGIYTLVATGFVIIYNVTGVINFAQGSLAMLAAMVASTLWSEGSGLGLGALAGVAASGSAAILTYWVAIRLMLQAAPIVLILLTVGVEVTLRGIALLVWGSQPRVLPPFSPGGPVQLFGAAVSVQTLWVLGLAAAALALVYLFLAKTYIGSAVRACMMNRQAAQLMGISPTAMGALAWGIGGVLSGLAGVAVTPISLATYDMGIALGLKGFVVSVFGGFTDIPLVVWGALLLGTGESLAAGLISSGWKDGIAFVLLLLFLLRWASWSVTRVTGERRA